MSTAIISTIAGTGTGASGGDNGAATSAKIKYPNGITLDSSGRPIFLIDIFKIFYSFFVHYFL